MPAVSDVVGCLPCRVCIVLAAAAFCSPGVLAIDGVPPGEALAMSDPSAPEASPSSGDADGSQRQGLLGATRLSEILDRMGRGPDRSEQGGACGGIVLHDWREENLRVITLGDKVQAIAPLMPESNRR